MNPAVKTLVAIDAGANRDAVEAVIPVQQSVELVGIVDGLEASWETLTRQPVDAVVVACAGDSEYALSFIDGMAREYPDRPVIVIAGHSANGLVGRAFAAGAEDVVTVPSRTGNRPRLLSASEWRLTWSAPSRRRWRAAIVPPSRRERETVG